MTRDAGAAPASLAARARRPMLGIAGQMLNAATNVVTVYLASLLLRPDAFGTLALAFAVVTVVLATGRGLVGSTMQVQLPILDAGTCREMVRSAVGFTLLVGAAASLVLAVLGHDALLWFAPWVAAALLQDAGRHAFLAVGRQGSALLLDVAWAVVQGLVIAVWLLSGHAVTIGLLATSWGLGALAGFGLFAVLARGIGWARPSLPGRWARSTRDVAGWFTGVAAIAQIELYLVLLLTGTLLGAAEAGGLRAAQLLAYQPALVVLGSLSILFTPLMVRARTSRPEIGRAWRRITVACSPVAAVLLLVAVLREPLTGLLFPQYVGVAALVVPIALQGVCSTAGVASLVMLRALRRGRIVFAVQALRALLMVGAAYVGLVLGGAVGLAWGLAAGSATMLVLISATACVVARRATPSPS